MRRINLLSLLTLCLLAACNTPTVAPTPTTDLVATQVAIMQTNLPTETLPAATPTPQPSLTQAPETPTTQPPTPTETATATTTAELKDSLGAPSWNDTLDSGSNFYLFENEGTRVTVENGALVLSGLQANGWLGWSLTYARQPQNFYIEASFTTQDCSGNDNYGVMFRATKENAGYFFGVTCSGAYDLEWANFNSDDEKVVIQSTGSPEIRSGANQANRLGVLANGDKISLYANGKLLQEITDSNSTDKGYFGAFVAANQTTGFTVKMDEINLWILP